jgi:hypothetical protein
MRRFSLLLAILAGTAACAHNKNYVAVDGAVLGRVVIYRNGVAFYERSARLEDGKVAVHVPRDRVDDFLKSLTVVDKATRKPISVSIPRQQADDGNYLTMLLETPDQKDADVLLTYVTDSPSWKPSYRVVVGDQGKVMLESWAIVDNVSGEDWKNVLVGVGSSSALSFRYDLWSVRRIDRDLLEGDRQFAVAPPTGMSPYSENVGGEELANIDAAGMPSHTFETTVGAVPGAQADNLGVSFSGSSSLENQYYVDGVNTTGLQFGTAGSDSNASAPEPPKLGNIRGSVSDSKNGERLAGVTVIATNKKTNSAVTGITDGNGMYTLAGLPPGAWEMTFYYGDMTVERTGVKVTANKDTPVFQKLDSSQGGGEMIKIADTAPTIDPASEKIGITLNRDITKNIPTGRTFDSTLGSAAGCQSNVRTTVPKVDPLAGISDKVLKSKKDIVIEAYGLNLSEVKERAERVRTRLVDQGVPASKIHVVHKSGTSDHRVRLLAVAPAEVAQATGGAPPTAGPTENQADTPVGESHFEAERPMNVRAGSSAMVAMLHGETTGGVVYLYDPISERGDDRFAFKAVRLDNPTEDTLEPGPITVYGDGRFIGEGITEPVPPKASVVIPFASDRQVLVTQNESDDDRIAKLLTAEHGIIRAELQHRKQTRFTVTSRLAKPSKVFLRHRLESGWKLVESPPRHMKVGDSTLFEVDLAPGETKYVTIAEATPVEQSLDLAAPDALDKMKVFLDDPAATPEVKAQLGAILDTHRKAGDLVDKIQTLRDQLGEYRLRSAELHAQVMTLKMVKTSGTLMAELKSKLADTSERMQKTTIAIVDTQEELMLIKVKFQNQLAELHLTDGTARR